MVVIKPVIGYLSVTDKVDHLAVRVCYDETGKHPFLKG